MFKSPLFLLFLSSFSSQRPELNFMDFDKFFSKSDKMQVGEYLIERRLTAERVPEVRLSRKGKLIRNFPNDVDPDYLRDYNQFGLFPLLSPYSRELIIQQYSGGAHCCTSYRFYDLSAEPLLLYDSADYPVGYEPFFVDMDADGVYEFSQMLLTFDYFDACSHADSALPEAFFKYDSKARRYKPANRLFAREILRNLPRWQHDLDQFKKGNELSESSTIYGQYLGKVLQVLVTYLYAGELKQGWAFFEREYQFPGKVKMRRKIEAELAGDSFYRAVANE